MRTILTFMAIVLSATAANADWCYKFVGYECDPTSNTITITYRGAFNEAGKEMLKNKRPQQWYLGDLIESMKDEDHIGSLKTIKRQCKLSDGTYTITFGPMPGNVNVQGKCGAWITGWVEVWCGSTAILPHRTFETSCEDTETPVVTSIIIKPGESKPIIKSVPHEEFCKYVAQPAAAPERPPHASSLEAHD